MIGNQPLTTTHLFLHLKHFVFLISFGLFPPLPPSAISLLSHIVGLLQMMRKPVYLLNFARVIGFIL